MFFPPAIIFINSDPLDITPDGYFVDGYSVNPDGYINDLTRNTLETQLFITETITLKEFNGRVSVDPNYPFAVHAQGLRVMVILPDFRDYTNRQLADLVLFYSHGMVTVEKNRYGPPGLTLPIIRLNIFDLLRDVGSKYVVILPITTTKPPRSLGGIVVDELADSSGVHDPNPDNEYNNPDFINRK